jgi:VCBS repeat-containing protein
MAKFNANDIVDITSISVTPEQAAVLYANANADDIDKLGLALGALGIVETFAAQVNNTIKEKNLGGKISGLSLLNNLGNAWKDLNNPKTNYKIKDSTFASLGADILSIGAAIAKWHPAVRAVTIAASAGLALYGALEADNDGSKSDLWDASVGLIGDVREWIENEDAQEVVSADNKATIQNTIDTSELLQNQYNEFKDNSNEDIEFGDWVKDASVELTDEELNRLIDTVYGVGVKNITQNNQTYTIKQGDTIWDLANKLKLEYYTTQEIVEDIKEANPWLESENRINGDYILIKPNENIKVPTYKVDIEEDLEEKKRYITKYKNGVIEETIVEDLEDESQNENHPDKTTREEIDNEITSDPNAGRIIKTTYEYSLHKWNEKKQSYEVVRRWTNIERVVEDIARHDPLALDLNHNRIIDTSNWSNSEAYFDLNDNGTSEKTGWIADGDGWLVYDEDGNGRIDNGNELFGTDIEEGYSVLKRKFDSNDDNVIDNKDERFNELQVWIDNGDGISQTDELKTLSELNITSINLDNVDTNINSNGNLLFKTSTFTQDSKEYLSGDLLLEVNNRDTNLNRLKDEDGNFTASFDSWVLPILKGSGDIPDSTFSYDKNDDLRYLAYQMNQDPQKAYDNFELFMGEWTGLEALHKKYGIVRENGYTLDDISWMYESLNGLDIFRSQIENALESNDKVGRILTTLLIQEFSYQVFEQHFASFAIQSCYKDVFESVDYSLEDDMLIVGDKDKLESSLIEYLNQDLTTKELSIFGYITSYFKGNLGIESELFDSVTNENNKLVIQDILSENKTFNIFQTKFDGSDNDEIIFGTAYDNTLKTNGGDDTLLGSSGDDKLYGGSGDDTYIYNLGDGHDTIHDAKGRDTIILGEGIIKDNIRFLSKQNDLIIIINENNSIKIKDWNQSEDYMIESIIFFDNTILTGNEIVTMIEEYVSDIEIEGDNSDETLVGNESINTLIGQKGDDILDGDANDDIFVFNLGDGNDKIIDTQGKNKIVFGENILMENITIERLSESSLKIHINDENSIEVSNLSNLSDITFYDGTQLTYNDIINSNYSFNIDSDTYSSGKQYMGFNGDDTFTESENNLSKGGKYYGFDGDDTFNIISSGNFFGGVGDDTYHIGNGGTYSRIKDIEGNDKIIFDKEISKDDIQFLSRYGSLEVYKNGQYFFRIDDYFKNENNKIETFEFFDGKTITKDEILEMNVQATDQKDYLYSYDGIGKIIDAKDGDDTIISGSGSNTIIGGKGNDTIVNSHYASSSDNHTIEYRYNIGDGHDTIEQSVLGYKSTSKIIFGEGITKESISIFSDSTYGLVIKINDNDSMVIKDWNKWSSSSQIDILEFNNGDTITSIEINDTLNNVTNDDDIIYTTPDNKTVYAGAGNDIVKGAYSGANDNLYINGEKGDDTLSGWLDNDILIGGTGDDYLDGNSGDDTLLGGTGNDYLDGNSGDDTYIFNLGDGHDIISDFSGNDKIVFGESITQSDLLFMKNNMDLIIKIDDENSITIKNANRFSEYYKLESLSFFDGTTLSLSNMAELPEVMIGDDNNNILNGGINTIGFIGNKGDDIIIDSSTDTHYTYNVGDGHDIITDYGGNDSLFIYGENLDRDSLYTYYEDTDLVFAFNDDNDNSIRVIDYKKSDNKIETVAINDDTIINPDMILNTVPIVIDDNSILDEDSSTDINILLNDSDSDFDRIFLSVISQLPLHGTLALNENGTIKYSPDENFFGEDSFKYIIKDERGGRSDEATVNITVESINDKPIITFIESHDINEDDITINGNIEAIDVDGDNLTFKTTANIDGFSLNSDGSYSFNPSHSAYQSLKEGEVQTLTIPVTVSDGELTDTKDLVIKVTGTNDTPVATIDTASVDEDKSVTINVLDNDSDIESDSITLDSITTNPLNGSVTINDDGTITYNPNADYHGNDSFVYKINDGNGGVSEAQVNITINSVNDAPIISSITPINIKEDKAIVNGNITATDIDSSNLTYSTTHTVDGFSLNSDGSYSFNPSHSAYQSLKEGEIQTLTIPVTVSDGSLIDTKDLVIKVTGTNDIPTIEVATESYALENTSTQSGTIGDVVDIDGDDLSYNVTTDPTHGTFTIDESGNWSYDPVNHYGGNDSVVVTIDDGNGGSVTKTLNFDVKITNNNPIANDDTISSKSTEIQGEVQVNTYTYKDQEKSSITSLNDGGYVVSWTSDGQDGSDEGIYLQRYDYNGEKVGLETLVNTNTKYTQKEAAITSLNDGGYIVSWTTYVSGNFYDIHKQRYNKEGQKIGGEMRVNTHTSHKQVDSSITSLDSGGYIVSWTSWNQDGHYDGVFLQRFNSNDEKVGGEVQVNTRTGSHQFDSEITTLKDDGFVVTWTSFGQDGDRYGVYAQRYNKNGEKEGEETLVNTYTGGYQSEPTIGALNDGGYIIAWESSWIDGDDDGIFTQRYDANGNKVGGETQVNTYIKDGQRSPSITALNDGGYVVSWESYKQDGSRYGIYTQKFNSDGKKVGDEIQVNTYTSGDQTESSITSLSDGGYIISWTSYYQDGNSNGIYTQRFDKDGNKWAPESKLQTKENESIIIDVLANDTDIDGDVLSIERVDAVLYEGTEIGSTEVINVDGKEQIKFVSNSALDKLKDGEKINVSFNYTITDGKGGYDSASVVLTILGTNDIPIIEVATESYELESTSIQSGTIGDVVDIDGDDLSYNVTTDPTHGTFTIDENGDWSYDPVNHYGGNDRVVVTIDDGNGGSVTKTLNFDVQSSEVSDNVSTTAKMEVNESYEGVIDIKYDQDWVKINLVKGHTYDINLTGNSLSDPYLRGVYDNKGKYIYGTRNDDGGPGLNSFKRFTANRTGEYYISAGAYSTRTGTYTLSVDKMNSNPTAVEDSVSVYEDNSVVINVLDNDSDMDGDSIKLDSISTKPSNGSVTINDNGTITYTPNADYHGEDSFIYKINDGRGGLSSAKVNITINNVNDAPIINSITPVYVKENEVLVVSNITATDIDGDNLTYTTTDKIDGFNLNSNGTYSFNPSHESYQSLDEGEVQIITISIIVSDGSLTDTKDLVITLTGTDGTPIFEGNIIKGTNSKDKIYGTKNADMIIAGAGDDYLRGDYGDDILNGGKGNDYLDALWGNDTLLGGKGDDTLNGYRGDDTYILNIGDGTDRITEYYGNDKIVFGENITQDDLSIEYDGNSLILHYSEEDSVKMSYWSSQSTYRVEEFVLNDGITITSKDIEKLKRYGEPEVSSELVDHELPDNLPSDAIQGTNYNDSIKADTYGDDVMIGYDGDDKLFAILGDDTLYGGNGNDDLYAQEGNDTLYGGNGDDYLSAGSGTDFLNGGKGDDILSGSHGSDTYFFKKGDGKDMIYEYYGDDKIIFDNTIVQSDITFRKDGKYLKIGYGNGDEISINKQGYSSTKYYVERFEDSNGNYLTSNDISILIQDINSYADNNGIDISSHDNIKANEQLMNIISSSWNRAS